MSADFQERMAIGKANAARARDDGGGSAVRVYATTAALQASRGNPEPGLFDAYLDTVRARCIEAIESVRAAIHAAEWEDFQ